jgi:hypothetical protein
MRNRYSADHDPVLYLLERDKKKKISTDITGVYPTSTGTVTTREKEKKQGMMHFLSLSTVYAA